MENLNSDLGDLSSSTTFWGKSTEGMVEMLKISKDGFWVRGVKVEQGPGEAEEVYNAFKSYLGVR